NGTIAGPPDHLHLFIDQLRQRDVDGVLPSAEDKGCGLEDLSLAEMQSVHSDITQDVFTRLGVDNSVASRTSHGGTSPTNVAAQIKAAKAVMGLE
ncbi:MAG: hypothetical protein AAF562_05090, partial [Pseudomonadota bacterium]